MVPHIIPRIRVHERAQRAPVDDEPGDEGAELRGREDVDLEHSDWMRTEGFFEEWVGAEFGDCCIAGEGVLVWCIVGCGGGEE